MASDVDDLFEDQLVIDDDPIDCDAGPVAPQRWFLVLRIVTRDVVPDKLFMAAMTRAWDFGAHVPIRPLGGNRFLAVFDQHRHYIRVKGGTWYFSDSMVSIGEFDGRGAPEDVAALSLPVWIQVLDLDLVYHSQTGLRMIGKALGNFLEDDPNGMLKKGVIRVRILQDVRQPIRFEREFIFRGDSQLCCLVYERVHGVCNTCGSFLHSSCGCTGPQPRRSPFPPAIHYPGHNGDARPSPTAGQPLSPEVSRRTEPPSQEASRVPIPPPGFVDPSSLDSRRGKETARVSDDLVNWNKSALVVGPSTGTIGSSSGSIILYPNPEF